MEYFNKTRMAHVFFFGFCFRFRFGSFWHFDKEMGELGESYYLMMCSHLKWNILFSSASSSLRNQPIAQAKKMRFDFVVIQYGRNFK